MGNIKMSDQQIKDLIHCYHTDRRLKELHQRMADLVGFSIPKLLICTASGSITFIYDKETEKEIESIKKIIAEIIKNDYSPLID